MESRHRLKIWIVGGWVGVMRRAKVYSTHNSRILQRDYRNTVVWLVSVKGACFNFLYA